MNFCKRSYQPILRYLYTETIKRGGEISLHKHFNYCVFTYVLLQYDYMLNIWQGTASLGLNMFQIKACFRQRIMLFTGLGHSTKRGIDKIQITV